MNVLTTISGSHSTHHPDTGVAVQTNGTVRDVCVQAVRCQLRPLQQLIRVPVEGRWV